MEKTQYTLKRYKKSKKLRLIIKRTGEVVITAPYLLPLKYINDFVIQQKEWIEGKQEIFKSMPQPNIKTKKGDYKKYKEQARILVHQKIEEINSFYNFKFNRIFIKDQKTRWGSCSSRKNLNFNYKIIFLPNELLEYVITHELCHLKEMNHGKKFWELIEQTNPEYKTHHEKLRTFKL
jgi:predicted metal-dependent hydrolase